MRGHPLREVTSKGVRVTIRFFTGKAPYHDGLVSNAGLGATLPSSAAMIDAKQCATWSAVADRAIPDASGSADMRGWRRQLVSACQSGLVRNSESREKKHAPLPCANAHPLERHPGVHRGPAAGCGCARLEI